MSTTEDPLEHALEWDWGTAYEFLLSLDTVFRPKAHGVPAPWAAGVRKRLSPQAQADFKSLMEPYLGDSDGIEDRLYEIEMQNLQHYGYGIKAFILSLIETAIQLTQERITAADVKRIMQIGRTMLSAASPACGRSSNAWRRSSSPARARMVRGTRSMWWKQRVASLRKVSWTRRRRRPKPRARWYCATSSTAARARL